MYSLQSYEPAIGKQIATLRCCILTGDCKDPESKNLDTLNSSGTELPNSGNTTDRIYLECYVKSDRQDFSWVLKKHGVHAMTTGQICNHWNNCTKSGAWPKAINRICFISSPNPLPFCCNWGIFPLLSEANPSTSILDIASQRSYSFSYLFSILDIH